MWLRVLTDPSNNVVGYCEDGDIGTYIEVPETFKDENFLKYKIVNEKLEKMSDEDFNTLYPNYYTSEKINIQNTLFSDIQRDFILQSLSNEKAIQLDLLYPDWCSNYSYSKDYIARYDNKLYRCLQQHKSQQGWEPSVASSLWVEISDPNEEYPQFKQPSGVHDCYSTGDKVTFEDNRYISIIDNNVWSPKDFPDGWKKVN